MEIKMVDLKNQYLRIKDEIRKSVDEVLFSSQYIKGRQVEEFEQSLKEYLGVRYAITCANGTDALQIALMSLDLKPNDEVICPSFSFIASAEVIALLGLRPVFVDVDYNNFNTTAKNIKQAISIKTKAIIVVHLFGQSAEMEEILSIAKQYNLYVIEDNAQSFGAESIFSDGSAKKLGTIGNIGCTSFFPTKNLACYGDGGAIFTDDDILAEKLRMIANHGSKQKYNSQRIGVNSRLDTLQAAILQVKLKYLDQYLKKRQEVANIYNNELKNLEQIILPSKSPNSTHTFNQYTIKVMEKKRNDLQTYLKSKNIPTAIYYPIALHKQTALSLVSRKGNEMTNTDRLCSEVLSLPMHTELSIEQQKYITENIKQFFIQEKK
ncbi:MAG: DegT/DnrJ/EryC1/StrS family aminotransferase [Bacteroidota bacterium]|nr:DegT/DnrJ/EryC1/StrS family aminotransferase [Bacteroidota bacterium]